MKAIMNAINQNLGLFLLKYRGYKQDFEKNINQSQLILSLSLNEGNSNRFMRCMESYFSKQLGCILPWTMKNNNQNNHGLNECKGKDKFKKFRTITGNILKAKGHKELIKSGI